MFKVGIVGCGGIGMTHARSWNSIEGVEVAAVMDLNEERHVRRRISASVPSI